MSDDNITGSTQPVFQTNDNDINTSLDHNSDNGDDSNENIDTGSEFDDLYSHEEDNDEQEEKDDQNDNSNNDNDNDNDNANAEYSIVETHREELNMHNDLSDKENDATSKEHEDKEQEQETQIEENNNKKTDVEAGRLEKSDSSSGPDSESTSGSDEEGEDDDDDNDDNEEEEEEDDDDEEEDEEQEDTEEADTEEKKDDTKNLKDVNFNLLERQIKYLVDSDMLHSDDFKALSKEGKITAIINLINSNPETALSGYTKNSNNSQNQSTTTTTTSSFSSSASNNKQALDYSNDSKPSSTSSTKDKPASKYERPNLSMPMTLKERDLYAAYLRGENKITEMHNIPAKSRLFIGNLPLKNVTKEDLFRIFIPYGHILQINIKNAFGFIQYDNPTSVLEAIKYESDEINFGKKLILEVSSSNSRPQFDHGDHGTNSSSTFISSSKRPFQTDGSDDGDLYNDGTGYKKPKRRVPHCVIYVKRTADRTFATEVFNSIKNGTGIETDMIFLKPRMELRKLINDAAYDGSWGVIIVNKSRNLDIQIFYEGPSGETKFDEYVNISCPDAVSIFNNIKNQRRGTMGIGMMPGSANMYGGYNQPPMGPNINAGYGYGSRYGSIPPQQIPQPPQGYMSYQAPGTNGYQAPPPPQQQPPVYGGINQNNYSRYQNQPAPPPPQGSMGMSQAYGKYPPQTSAVNQTPAAIGTAPSQQSILTQSPPQNNVQPQLSAALNGNPTQMDQQQLLAAIQNLPPNVVSSLLSAAQQQQQPPNQQQQQLLGMLQNTQNQQTHQPQNTYSQMGGSSSYDSSKMQSQPQPQNQPPPQQQPGSNVQSLLDSLAKLQK
ncbi:hypothetical protein RI543_003591 [Arxiozyma heterogenica]|uniref:RRM domain-containing protein n=1 Tax=Arxiozyma heterogenica TaxID=278026 RepID=A0AAN7WPD7_9SACH|nr:hypothetical protein RI543_003591 [Kazachstania heterogenica]